MTNDEARAYFRESGLTYEDITIHKLYYLVDLLDEQFIKQRKELTRTSPIDLYWRRVNRSKTYKAKFDERGMMIHAFITGSGEYFDSREVISFNRDGFIGFCGAAGTKNTAPVLAAFIEWCDWLAGKVG